MRLTAALAFLSLTACSVGTFTGTVGGVGFTPKDASFGYAHFTSSNAHLAPNLGIAIVALSSSASACSDFGKQVDRRGSKTVYFTLYSTAASASALPKGDYPLSYPADTDPNSIVNVGYAYFNPLDANCTTQSAFWDAAHNTLGAAAVADAGSIELTAASQSALAADFKLTFGNGDSASGNLSASPCDALRDAVNGLAALDGYVLDNADNSADDSAAAAPTCEN